MKRRGYGYPERERVLRVAGGRSPGSKAIVTGCVGRKQT